MAYDERLAERIEEILSPRGDVESKKMFGGVAFMVKNKMAVGIVRTDLMVRVGSDRHEQALSEPHVREMDFAGKPMRGMIYVAPEGLRTDAALRRWVDAGVAYVTSLPNAPRKSKTPAAKSRIAKPAPAAAKDTTKSPAARKPVTAKRTRSAAAEAPSAKPTAAKNTNKTAKKPSA